MGNEDKRRRPSRTQPPERVKPPRERERRAHERARELEWHLESVVQYATD